MKLVKQIGRVGKEHTVELSKAQESRAMGLHKNSIIFDMHMHSFILPEDPKDYGEWIESGRYELGYEGIKKAGLTGYIDFGGMGHSWDMDVILRSIGLRWYNMEQNHDKVIRATSAEDVLKAKKENKTAIFFGIENAEPI